MADEFANLLTGEDSKAFELHQRTLDSSGTEKYIRADKEAVAHKTRITNMANEIASEVAMQTFAQRVKWIEERRQVGNNLFKESKYEEALNTYMTALCALDFKSCSEEVTEEQDKMA